LCYYSFFGIPIKPYFSTEDYVNEIFSSWPYLIICSGIFFFIQFTFHYTNKWLISSQSDKNPTSPSFSSKGHEILILVISSLSLIYFTILIILFKVTGNKENIITLIGSVPLIFSITFYALLNYFPNFMSLNMTKFKIFLITFVVLIFSMKLASYINAGYITKNLKSATFKETIYFNKGVIIETSDSILYLGSSKDYIFTFNKPQNKAVIYSRSNILRTEIDKK
jgi:hypothetical protein